MACKVVLFYNQAAQGWTETYYAFGDNPKTVIDSFQDVDYQSFVTWRAPPTVLYGIRVTNTGTPRQSVSKVFAGKYLGQGNILGLQILPDVASTDAVYRLGSLGRHKRQLALRGLLDDMVVRNAIGADIETPLLRSAMGQMFQTIQARGLGLFYQKRPGELVTPPNPVLGVDKDAGSLSTSIVTVINPPDLARPVPRKVTFLGVPTNDLPGFPKSATIVAVIAGPPHIIKIAYRFRNQAAVFPAAMRYLEQEFVYDPLISKDFVGYRERKTGRPFGVPHGRVRPAVKAQ